MLGSAVSIAAQAQDVTPHSASEWGLPSMHITADNHPFHMPRTQWHDGMVAVTGFSEDGDFDFVDVRLRGRGNSTWYQDWALEKRPLRLRFEAEPRSMFGSEYIARDWILLADARDPTLLRNYSAFDFTRRMGTNMQYVPMAQQFHLYINGEYKGVYLLTDERDVNDGRMDLTFNEDPALSDFFLEFCVRVPNEGGTEGDHFVMVNGKPYDIRFPTSGSQRRAHAQHLQDFLYEVSEAIRYGCWCRVEHLIDLDSFVDFYLVMELFHNKSINYSSTFMYITDKGNGQQLFMGPIWDFDHVYDGTPWHLVLSPPFPQHSSGNYWFRNLLAMPEFRAAVRTRWNQLMVDGIPQATVARVRYLADTYSEDFARNFERQTFFDNHQRSVRHYTRWLDMRICALNRHFNARTPSLHTRWPNTQLNWFFAWVRYALVLGWLWMDMGAP